MKTCPKCNTQHDGNFCPNCGTPSPEAPLETQVSPSNMPPQQAMWNSSPSVTNNTQKSKAGIIIAIVAAALLVVIIIIVIICVALGSTAKKHTSTLSETQSTVESEIESTSSNGLMDFDESTNILETFQGVSYQVPESWTKQDGTEGSLWYYPPRGGLLQVSATEAQATLHNKTMRSAFVDGMKSGMGVDTELQEEEISIDNETAYKYTGTAVINDDEYNTTIIAFDCADGFMVILFATPSDSPYDYLDDFDAILDSIQINENDSSIAEPPAESQTNETINLIGESGTLKYVKHELSTNYEGNPVILIYFDYTNTGEEAENAQLAFHLTTYQNGIECDFDFPADTVEANQNISKKIQPGTTLQIAFAYELQDTQNPVTVEVSELFKDKKQTQILNL